jgi:hypothetical protein
MHARITTYFVPPHRFADALNILRELAPSLREHSLVTGFTVLADRRSGKLTTILYCASAAHCDQLPEIHLKGLASGEPRQEDVAVDLHEQYPVAP